MTEGRLTEGTGTGEGATGGVRAGGGATGEAKTGEVTAGTRVEKGATRAEGGPTAWNWSETKGETRARVGGRRTAVVAHVTSLGIC